MADPVIDPAQATPEAGKEPVTTPPAADPAKATPPAADPKTAEPPVPPVETVPESYDLKVPEESLLQTADVERLKAEAKELGLTNEEAQEYLDTHHKAVTAYRDAEMVKVKEMQSGWLKECEADTEIGGAEFKKNAELAKRVVERVGSDTFKKMLNETGFGNHPEVVRTFARIGKMMSEDQLVLPKAQAPVGKSENDIAAKMYPSMAGK